MQAGCPYSCWQQHLHRCLAMVPPCELPEIPLRLQDTGEQGTLKLVMSAPTESAQSQGGSMARGCGGDTWGSRRLTKTLTVWPPTVMGVVEEAW